MCTDFALIWPCRVSLETAFLNKTLYKEYLTMLYIIIYYVQCNTMSTNPRNEHGENKEQMEIKLIGE